MTNQKRASMREGPLAALFRNTAEVQEEQAKREAAAPAPSTEAGKRDYPHPSLGATPPGEPVREELPAPSPSERLRGAFSSESETPAPVAAEPVVPEPAPVAPPEPAAAPAPRVERRAPEAAPERSRLAPPPAGDPFARPAYDNPWADQTPVGQPTIRVVGVGGAGVNAVNRMVEAEVEGVEFIAINTDLQSLQQSIADITLHIGPQITRGLGAGANPDLGRAAAMEEYDKIKALLKGADMVFIAAGAGGGTGTGAAPIVARIARELGALTVGIVTKPFGFEGTRRAGAADLGIQALGEEVDTLIVVPNNRLLTVLDKQVSMMDAFRVADDVLRQGVQGISDLVTLPGLINLDFADVRTIMSDAGNALLGIGMGSGPDRAGDAAAAAVASPLLETSMDGARKILLSITAGGDLSLFEVNEAAKAVAAAAHPDANIIFGAMVDEKLDDQVWVTVVATGFEAGARPPRRIVEEPAGEPRVARTQASSTQRTGLGVRQLDVPEFVPRR